jgi:hypothetical protein
MTTNDNLTDPPSPSPKRFELIIKNSNRILSYQAFEVVPELVESFQERLDLMIRALPKRVYVTKVFTASKVNIIEVEIDQEPRQLPPPPSRPTFEDMFRRRITYQAP